uniref:SAP-like protein BP-73 n=1 Tax=Erigeron canadensis TaxID=72917 RepID=UPI001CB9621A|nr:SAP-like protein BP-73 [Erigeron canadensis]
MLHQPNEKKSRPASNFVKRSPIPSLYAETLEDEVKSVRDGEELEMMKLAELKELAKSRRVKGYSKLKKGELINLLKTL